MRKWVIGCFVVFPILCCGGGVLISRKWVDAFDQSSKLDRLVVDAKKHGFPFEAKELARTPSVPKSENSKDSVIALGKELGSKAEFKKSLSTAYSGTPNEVPQSVAEFADRARKIAAFKTFDGDNDLDLSTYVLHPEYETFKAMVKSLAVCADVKARNGQSDKAISDLQAIRTLTGQLTHDTNAIGGLVVVALDQIYLRTGTRVSQSLENDPVALAKVRECLASPLPLIPFDQVLRGEFYMFLSLARNDKMFRKLNEESSIEKIDKGQILRTGMPKGMIWKAQLATYIEHMIVIDGIVKSEKNLNIVSNKIEDYVSKIPSSMSSYVPGIYLDGLGGGSMAWERMLINQRIAVRCSDLLMGRSKSGFPATIDPIKDPFGKGNLIYKKTKEGFKLFSVGKNGKDDGGPKNKTDRKKSDDIGFEYPYFAK